jgi:TonB family protein
VTLGLALLPALAALLTGCAGDQEIERPTPLQAGTAIEYPLSMWDRDVEGQTLLRVLVSETGAVKRVEVMQSSGHAQLDSAAVEGARDLRFQPAMRAGRRIEVWATVPVAFSKKPKEGGGVSF